MVEREYVVYDESGGVVERFEDKPSAYEKCYRLNRLNKRNPQRSFHVETEQNDETTVNNNMSYSFITEDDNDSEENQTNDKWNWGFGDHNSVSANNAQSLSDAIGATMDELDGEVDSDLMGVLQDASKLVESSELEEFECSHEDCGLGHHHPDWKHDIRNPTDSTKIRSNIAGFNITQQFAEEMEFIPYCHCGANEAAMLVQFFPYFTTRMFKDQTQFEGVLEMDPDHLDMVYRRFDTEQESVSRAVARVAVELGEDESEVAPLGIRDDLEAFLERRQQMEQQADKAPIGQETRTVIEDLRESIEEVVNQ